MTYRRLAVSLCVASVVVFASPVAGQEMKAEKEANVDYHEVVFVKFKPGKRVRANEIINTYFAPTGRETNTGPSVAYHMQTGTWDFVVVWPMKGGTADMEWATHPDEVTWWKAFVKRAGSEAEAKKLDEEFDSLIADRVAQVAHTHRPAK